MAKSTFSPKSIPSLQCPPLSYSTVPWANAIAFQSLGHLVCQMGLTGRRHRPGLISCQFSQHCSVCWGCRHDGWGLKFPPEPVRLGFIWYQLQVLMNQLRYSGPHHQLRNSHATEDSSLTVFQIINLGLQSPELTYSVTYVFSLHRTILCHIPGNRDLS